MVTDPTRSIRRYDHPSTFDIPADKLLSRIVDLPAQSEIPYLTITLDWTILGDNPGRRAAPETNRSEPRPDDGGSSRPARTQLEQTFKQLLAEHESDNDLRAALEASRDRVLGWLQNDLDAAASGVYIVSHEPSGVFEATGLNLPVETDVTLAPLPLVYKLVRLIEDYPTYAVLQADQETATLSFITRGSRDRSVTLESTLYPRKQHQGGWSQKRYQKRADERVEAFARDTLEQVDIALQDTGVDVLILAGSEVMMSALNNSMPERLKDIVFDTVRIESVVSDQERIDQTLPVAETAERKREDEAVESLKNAIGQGDLGVSGPDATVEALQNGQVSRLVMNDTFEGNGWADFSMQIYGAGNMPTNHPAGGDATALTETDLRDELVRLALATDAEVEIIHSSVPVDEHEEIRDADEAMPMTQAAQELGDLGGVGAILRYALTGDTEPETI